MVTITEKQYNEKPEDYKGVYSSDEIHGTNLNGRRTLLYWEEKKGTCLLVEGESLTIIS